MTLPMNAGDDCSDLFDTSNYASTVQEKLWRSFQLAGKYYFADVPRYWWQRRQLGLSGVDLAVIGNPLREFRRLAHHDLPSPPRYLEALRCCGDAGVRFALPPVRLHAVASAWWASRDVAGDVIECGAYRGSTSLLLATLGKMHGIAQRVLVLDTFRGVPAASAFDGRRPANEFVPPEDQVNIIRQQASRLHLGDQVEVWQGLFDDTFTTWSDRLLRFSFVHIDANIYQGTLDASLYCIPRTLPGGHIVFDDYNGLADLGARLAIDNALGPTKLKLRPLAHCSAITQIPVENMV